ncbi:phytoene/squalene synthase family protein [Halolamina sp. CBA1230]|uniref:phytoene/squalene synthase family protein n=1 Tax=Halolamina sp. CBA1230 TaxID=1853690 RepID=UPI0009A1AA58|nr:phytoene/squalene synthase family protein [Halolamina sp. CBA1230]QKY20910.1 phytoene/squalene synthase family protein [Halolamina sp. CBA1230]
MVERQQLARSKRIHRETGKTFYVATRFLPERVRHPTYVLYAFFRVADEVVDGDNELDPAERAERLESFRRAALGEEPTDDPVLAAFAEIRERHGIPASDVNTFVDAMATDVETARYETYDELRTYMDGSAAAVGRMMTAVMAPEHAERALPAATALGEAFQLTNFVRDVREDVIERDRIYLPAETLETHGASHEQIARLAFDGNVARAVQAELSRAEALYRDGVAGIELLPRDCQFPVLLAAILYVDHHRLIRNLGYDVVSTAPSLSTPRKLWLAARARIAWQRSPDPIAVFRAVSAIPSDDTGHRLHRATGRLPVP